MNDTVVDPLGRIKAKAKDGSEQFHFAGREAGFDLYSFWRWSVSDLISNATRGRLAEFIVATAVRAKGDVRAEWDAYDLETPSGIKIEVKSAAYVQSWFQKKLSSISFLCRATRGWNAETNYLTPESRRWADLYVFALFHQTKGTIDPLDLNQWEFYVVGVDYLNKRTRSQHSITLSSLLKDNYGPVKYAGLAEAVEGAAKQRSMATAAVSLAT